MDLLTEISPSNVEKWLTLLRENWLSPLGLILGVIASWSACVFLLSEGLSWKLQLLSYTFAALAVAVAWLWSRRAPRTKRNRIGIAVSLDCESPEVAGRVRADFVRTLKELVTGGKTGPTFQVLEIPSHLSKHVQDTDDARDIQRKTRAHLVLFGRVRQRDISGETNHIFHMDGLISHKPIPQDISQSLSAEFGSIFPRRVRFGFENDILAFNFLSEWTETVAKYIIGISVAISGNIDYAERLYRDVETELRARPDMPALARIRQALPVRLVELEEIRARAFYSQWRLTESPQAIEQLGRVLSRIDRRFNRRGAVLYTRSLWIFLSSRNASKALKLLLKNKREDDATWHLNVAFLHVYNGDLKKAARHYRQIEQLEMLPETLIEVEDFQSWLLGREPDKVQIRYAQGLIACKIKGDKKLARAEFETFLRECPEDLFAEERELAKKWTEDLDEAPSS